MKTLTELATILEHLGSSMRDASHWIARDEMLAKRLPETIAGSVSKFSRIDAIDLVLVAALVKAGASPSAAVAYAGSVVRAVRATGNAPREWIVFPSGRMKEAIGCDLPDPVAMLKEFGEVPLCFVPIGALVRMVDKLYEAD